MSPDTHLWPFEVFFDGATKRGPAGRAAGAAAILWRVNTAGAPICVGRMFVAIPGLDSAPAAESQGARAAVRMLTRVFEVPNDIGQGGPFVRHARICGDCPQTVRYANAQARMRVVSIRDPLDQALEAARHQGWRLMWQAIRRRQNGVAHGAATAAALWAYGLLVDGYSGTHLHVEWANVPAQAPMGLACPPWP